LRGGKASYAALEVALELLGKQLESVCEQRLHAHLAGKPLLASLEVVQQETRSHAPKGYV